MATDAKKYSYWQQHFKRWQESALTQRAYCAREGLAPSTFDRWRRLIRTGSVKPDAALTLVPVPVESPVPPTTLRSPAGWELRLPASLPLTDLAILLRQLP